MCNSIVPRVAALYRRRIVSDELTHAACQLAPGERMPRMAFHWTAERKLPFIVRIGRAPEKFLKIVHGQIQVKVVHVSTGEMQLADDLRPHALPVTLRVVAQVEAMLTHVLGHVVIDLACYLVPQWPRIPIRSNRAIYRL